MNKMTPHPISSPEAYLVDMFHTRTVAAGGVVRRKVRDIERYVGRDAFVTELRRRGFRAIENGGHFVVFCNQEPLRLID